MFFSLPDWALALVIVAVVLLACGVGVAAGRLLDEHSHRLREPLGIVQGAVLGIVGLVLAFGLTLAIDRYENRRAAVVDTANTIETTYLRAETLREPERTEALALLRRYAGLALQLSHDIPGSGATRRTTDAQLEIQRDLWRLAGRSLARAPEATAPRLYVDSLNSMIDQRTTRASSLGNRIPGAVLALELIGAAIALAMLTLYLTMLDRGHVTIALVATLVAALLLVTFDLDRPTRGLIQVPSGPLHTLQDEMAQPPAAAGP